MKKFKAIAKNNSITCLFHIFAKNESEANHKVILAGYVPIRIKEGSYKINVGYII